MLLIVGATGELGGRIARSLLERGEAVRALVREGSEHGPLEGAGAELVFGDLTKPETLPAACAGIETVLTTASASVRGGGADTIEAVDGQGTRDLIDVARQTGVRRFVHVSAHGFKADSGVPLVRAKTETEAHLRKSGLEYTILTPVAFMEAWIGHVIGGQLAHGPSVTLAGDGEKPMGFISVEDVAAAGTGVVGDPKAANAELPLCGDAASFRDVVRGIERVTGRPIAVETVPIGEPVPGLPPIIAELWPVLDRAGVPPEGVRNLEAYGIQPVTVERFVARTFGGG
ncbi:MAG TPA: SDR family oxidoreductase [Gemmatimonadota bacterium]|nr:SDR family oxidoreductase [Gemmatimonadota bacterium]